MVKYTLKQCKYFVAIEAEGGIAQASRKLNISQPALALALDKLEELYGFQLLQRHHAKGTELTPQGRAFLPIAKQLLSQAEFVDRAAEAIAANQSGLIRFGCFHTMAPFYLPDIIHKFKQAYPDVVIQAHELMQDEIIAGLENGELDVAITYDMALDQYDFSYEELRLLQPFLLLPEDHPLSGYESLSLQDMAAEPYVMFDGPFSRDYFAGILKQAEIDPPVVLNATTMESVRCAVASGMGFSMLAMRPKTAETYNGRKIASVEIKEDVGGLPMVMVEPKKALSTSILEAFKQICRDGLDPKVFN